MLFYMLFEHKCVLADLLLPITTRNFKITLREVISVSDTQHSVNLSMSQKRISEFFKNLKDIKVSRTNVDDSTTTFSMSSFTTGSPVNIGPAVQSANVVPSSPKHFYYYYYYFYCSDIYNT